MTRPCRISIITPTYGRSNWLAALYGCVASQTVEDFEWLVLDDSITPSPFLQALPDERVRYQHVKERRKIGAKRNVLCEQARAPVIVQFDDDDYYAPRYLERMLKELENADIAKLVGAYMFSVSRRTLGYWDFTTVHRRHYVFGKDQIGNMEPSSSETDQLRQMRFGFGYALAFKKSVWEAGPFPDRDLGEDAAFIQAGAERFRLSTYKDEEDQGLCLHTIHKTSTSRCFPQYLLPPFMLGTLFPGAEAWLTRALRGVGTSA